MRSKEIRWTLVEAGSSATQSISRTLEIDPRTSQRGIAYGVTVQTVYQGRLEHETNLSVTKVTMDHRLPKYNGTNIKWLSWQRDQEMRPFYELGEQWTSVNARKARDTILECSLSK